MITFFEIGGKLKISIGNAHLTPPFTAKAFGDTVIIRELGLEPGKIERDFSEFQKSDSSTFASAAAVIDYLTPFMGFSTAPGGSGATVYETSILNTAPSITTMGSSPIDLTEHFPALTTEGQFYNILEVITIFSPGTVAYSGTDRFTIYGAFYMTSDQYTLNAHAGSSKRIAIARSTREFIFMDGAYSTNSTPSFTADQGLYLSTWTGDDVSSGNGTLEVRVKYTIENL